MKKILVINGFPKSGKDEFVNICKDILKQRKISCHNISTVDKVKEIATLMRWDGKKSKKSRKFLSDLKDLYTEFCDGPIRDIEEFIKYQLHSEDDNESIVFIHCREPNEIKKIVDKFNAKSVLIRRFNFCEEQNHADLKVDEYGYDYIIENKEDIELLKLSCRTFINNL